MLSKGEIKDLQVEVDEAIDLLFIKAKENSSESDYILFLSRSKFECSKDTGWKETFVCDYAMDEIKDKSRVKFLIDYLNAVYHGKTDQLPTDLSFLITIELMIYTHIWESYRNLATYKRLADLVAGRPYNWNVQFKDNSKYKFIQNQIKQPLTKKCPKTFKLLSAIYKSQYRNAFAHSQYHFEFGNDRITLENYVSGSDDCPEEFISFKAWTKVFLQSSFFQIGVHNRTVQELKKLEKESYEVYHPKHKSMVTINFDRENLNFRAQ